MVNRVDVFQFPSSSKIIPFNFLELLELLSMTDAGLWLQMVALIYFVWPCDLLAKAKTFGDV